MLSLTVVVLLSVGASSVVAAIGFAIGHIQGECKANREECVRLRKQLADLSAPHTQTARARADAAEAILFDLVKVQDEAQYFLERLDFAAKRASHIRNGGNPDDMRRPRSHKKG